ncbi:2-succinyl-5-enolpyruvyl-6-hydroxy-3-cyclohexene-1-carboxylic-acid synthase [Cellulomonas sp. H30R-01]|uniref:2-succinyl-5-enolpyruvyl-6-hydroxy-3- cyclohexene-1-carboxylic-acid synthase n=1 Tax=Cellulomonas sp. H30R-01 TaxID=2704467 RepID=UPI00138CF224|nr:2-succinyl-5-enolpyruvyl-6-hydroxy-3-cyclohexene-1-carboxylic-acid synthase [Cellulomonas sp. H30R-01]QHT56677.1 2-succinyl-5-enolpyruvyl-6-hydroxy-3-cyclohexene-1-carboxylic-acid synthase [Cellulomonas sp. H30R-01]
MMSDVTTQPRDPSPATTAARVLVQALATLGVRDVVLAPGSRSAPLAYALADAARPDDERPAGAPAIRLHVRIDERSAGFLALGLARAAAHDEDGGARPVAVVTTSGTAVANLHPAVLEAHHAGVPLLLLTADRPHELRGTGANQTTVQPGIFGAAVRLAADVPAPVGLPDEARDLRHLVSRAVAAATGARTGDPGPVHLDLAYREPLVPPPGPWPEPSAVGLGNVQSRGAGLPGAVTAALPAVVDARAAVASGGGASGATASGRRRGAVPTVVVAGDGAGPVARRVAEACGWPLLAEPSSGARGGPNAIAAYRLLLADPRLGSAVRRVVVLGRPTLSRPVQRLLGRADVEVVVVAPQGGAWPDAARNASDVLTEVPARMLRGRLHAPTGWLEAWQTAGKAADAAVDALLDGPGERDARRSRSGTRVTGPALARAVAGVLQPHDVLVVGSSNPVRDLDLVARWDTAPLVLANRGLAGIDGTLSTAAGVALGLPRRRVRALVGDLTFLHDVGGLLRGPLEPVVDLQVVVANDDGGSIFATLEPGEPERSDVFERVFATPHGVDVAALCAGYGVRHTRVVDAEGLLPALAAPGPGLSVVEVRVDRTGRRALGERVAADVARAVDGALG